MLRRGSECWWGRPQSLRAIVLRQPRHRAIRVIVLLSYSREAVAEEDLLRLVMVGLLHLLLLLLDPVEVNVDLVVGSIVDINPTNDHLSVL